MPRDAEKFEPKFEREVKPETEEKEIALLEKTSLHPQQKLNLVLAYLEKKPTSIVEAARLVNFAAEKEKEEPLLKEATEEKEELQDVLEESGFIYKIKPFHPDKERKDDVYQQVGYSILVSRNEKDLNRLIGAENDKEIGLALGYPRTAIEAYPDRSLDYKKLGQDLSQEEKDKLLEEGVFKFLNFTLSENHWREELDKVREYKNLIEEKAPNLYREIMALAKDPVTERWPKTEEGIEETDEDLKQARQEIERAFSQDEKELRRRSFLEKGKFTKVNEVMFFERGKDSIRVYLAPSWELGTSKTIELVQEGFKKLAKIVERKKEIKEITATSRIAAEYPGIMENLGFTLKGQIDEETRQKYFSYDDGEIGNTSVRRKEFLDKYLEKEK